MINYKRIPLLFLSLIPSIVTIVVVYLRTGSFEMFRTEYSNLFNLPARIGIFILLTWTFSYIILYFAEFIISEKLKEVHKE